MAKVLLHVVILGNVSAHGWVELVLLGCGDALADIDLKHLIHVYWLILRSLRSLEVTACDLAEARIVLQHL